MKQKESQSAPKRKLGGSLKTEREIKVMHGQYIRRVDRQLVGEEDTLICLLLEVLKGETGSEIIATQDQALQTKYHSKKNYYKQKERTNEKCKQFDERVERIISACPILAKEQYIQGHYTVRVELHSKICKEKGGKLYNKHQCDYVPELV
jgi:hypothetical protein